MSERCLLRLPLAMCCGRCWKGMRVVGSAAGACMSVEDYCLVIEWP